MERRRNIRTQVLFDTVYTSGRAEGEAILTDVSSTGARVEDASVRPPLHAEVRLVVLPLEAKEVRLVGVVVRHTVSGFAVRFKEPSPEALTLLEELEDAPLLDGFEDDPEIL